MTLGLPGADGEEFFAYMEDGAYFGDPVLPGQPGVGSWQVDQVHVLSGGPGALLAQKRLGRAEKEAMTL